jgi:hypothetical protein
MPPASGNQLHQAQPEPTVGGTGGAGPDRAVTVVLDFDPNDAVVRGGLDVDGCTGGLTGVPDAVGDQLGHEQGGVSVQLGVRCILEPTRDGGAGEKRASGPLGTVALPTSTRPGG